MKFYKCLGRTSVILIWLGVLLSAAGLFIFSDECKNGAFNGIIMCLEILVPSLFPFFILSSFLAESQIIDIISPVLNPIGKSAFKLRGICLAPVILALCGGYPVGAKTVAALFRKGYISESEAERLGYVCCSAGPGFLVTFIGSSLLMSKDAGIILLSSQIISIAVILFTSRFFSFNDSGVKKDSLPEEKISFCEALVNSVSSAVKSTAVMCGFVILFSIVCNVITTGFGIANTFGIILVSLLEITAGVCSVSGELSLEIISALTGFGGFCVHMQIFRELKGIKYSKIKFFIYRIIQSMLCYISTKLLLIAFPVTDMVFSTVEKAPQLTFYSSIAGTVALLITSSIFILSLKKRTSLRR